MDIHDSEGLGMHSFLQPIADLETATKSASGCLPEDPGVSTLEFIESCFIPKHVELKTQAGRTHYRAILKHVLRPETVDRLLLPYKGVSKSRMKSIPEWPYLDETKLCDICPDHVRQLTSLAVTHGYSPQTVKHIKNVVYAIISHAKRERILSGDNPIAEVHLPPIKRRAYDPISLFDAKAIFRMMGYPERQISLIVLNSNMSVSEVCALQWNHVNLTQRTAYVEDSLVPPRSILVSYRQSSAGLTRVTADRVRTIELSPSLADLIDALSRQRCAFGGFIFSSRSGTPISPARILKSKLKPIGRRLGIDFSWHTLKEIHDVLLQDLRAKLNSELAIL